MIFKTLYAALIFLCVTMIACSKSDATAETENPSANNGKTVNINGRSFSPATRTIAKGTSITFKNNDRDSHTATADDGHFDTDTIAPGATAEITFKTAGSFPYHCNFHGAMTGTIVVNP